MTDPSSAELLGDSDRLQIALDELSYLGEQYSVLENIKEAPPDLEVALRGAVHELREMLTGKDMVVSGTMLMPTTDEFGHVIDICQASGTLEKSTLSAITVLGEEVTPEFPRGTVVLQFAYGEQVYDTLTEETRIIYRAAFAVNGCNIQIVDELDDIIGNIQPDDDDEFAQEVDLLLLNGEFQLGELAELVKRTFPDFTEMQREMYVAYINQVGELDGKTATLTATRAQILEVEDGTRELLEDCGQEHGINGTFKGYYSAEVVDSEENTHPLLGIIIGVEDTDMMVLVFIQDLTSLEIED